MNPTGIASPVDGIVVIGGIGGNEYQVFDSSTESNPVLCGMQNVDSGINGLTTVEYPSGNKYVYIITNDSNAEYRIIRGGPGGGGDDGYGYADYGVYISNTLDTEKPNTKFFYVHWDEILDIDTEIKMQIRTSNSQDFSEASWFGPDGTSNTFFTNSTGETIPLIADGKRYLQAKIIMTSDTDRTPILNSFSVNYQ